MNEFHFLRPEWFWGGFVFLLLLFFFFRRKNSQGGLWQKLCDGVLLRFQLVTGKEGSLFWVFFLTAVSWLLTLISLAGPTWERLPQPAVKKGTDTVYVMDISVLMTPTDIKPSRMERALFKMHDLLQKTKDGQNALILYGQDPFVAVPLTNDRHIIDNLLSTIQAGMMGNGMPNPVAALNSALNLLIQGKTSAGRIVVLSGALPDDMMPEVLKIAEKIKSEGHSLSFLGIGTMQGAPLQMSDGSFLTHSGKPVLTGMSKKNMKKAARAGNGKFQTVTLDEKDIDTLLNEGAPVKGSAFSFDQDQTKADAWKDFGAILCIFILPFALLGYRKGWLGIWLFWILLFPSPVQAWTISDLWTRADRKEAISISSGKETQHPEVFKDSSWQGVAAYKAGDYATAVSALTQKNDAETLYNRGNALAQTGQYQQAIEAYASALKKAPSHADAAFNKKYLEEQLKKNQNQQQNQKQKQDQQQQQQNQQQKQEQQQQQDQQQKQEQQQQQDQQQKQERQQQLDQQQKQEQQQQQNQQQKQEQEQQQKSEQQKKQAKKKKQPEQKASPEQKTDKDPEKQEQMQWLSVIKDDPSGLLRERIRRRNLAKRGKRQ